MSQEFAKELREFLPGDRFSFSLGPEHGWQETSVFVVVEWGYEGRAFKLAENLGPRFFLMPKPVQKQALRKFAEYVRAYVSQSQKSQDCQNQQDVRTLN